MMHEDPMNKLLISISIVEFVVKSTVCKALSHFENASVNDASPFALPYQCISLT